MLGKSLLCITIGIVIGQSAALAKPSQREIALTPTIATVQGRVELKRKTASDAGFQVIKKGPVSLKFGDQLRLSPGAIVKIACPDAKTPTEVKGTGERLGIPSLCPKWKPVIGKGEALIASMGGTNPKIPYLIFPRRTLLLSSTPTLRWNPVAGAIQYTVQIRNAQGMIWQTQTQDTQLTYPGTPALQPGTPYAVTIQTNTGNSAHTEPGDPFLLLREADAKAVQTDINRINQSDFSPEIKALKLAEYYTAYEVPDPTAYGLTTKTAKYYHLDTNAIAILETVLKQNQPSPLFYRMLGDVYTQTGVLRPAEQAYLQAIENVQSLEDLEEWSLIAAGLGQLYEASQDSQQAILWYTQAKTGFMFLSDDRAIAVDRSIERLKKEVSPLTPKR